MKFGLMPWIGDIQNVSVLTAYNKLGGSAITYSAKSSRQFWEPGSLKEESVSIEGFSQPMPHLQNAQMACTS